MYYGHPADTHGVIGTQPKKGSHRAYKFASISIISHGEKLTLAVTPVGYESRVAHVKTLVEHTFSLGIRPKIVLLDGAYNSAEIIINYLNGNKMKYVIRISPPPN